jgi:uncharacterized protein (TIGR00255 family)
MWKGNLDDGGCAVLLSMTGFGRASVQYENFGFEIEVRSVNHRHLDARVRVPRVLSACEAEFRAQVQQRIGRGKVDMTIALPNGEQVLSRLEIDRRVAEEYIRVAAELGDAPGVTGNLNVDTLIGLPGVARLVDPELPIDEFHEVLVDGVEKCLDALVEMRASEGEAIETDLLARLAKIEKTTHTIEQRSGVVLDAVRERLRKRTEQIRQETGLLDEARLHQEVVIAADRMDITEEIVRLRSHIAQFRDVLHGAGVDQPVGRRLDFLLQELSREVNTIGSKGGDAPIAHEVVELKTELERIREQVQNVE